MAFRLPYQCWDCNRIEWRKSVVRLPKCPECGKDMRLVAKGNCNVCGRQLINEQEDRIGLCRVCQ